MPLHKPLLAFAALWATTLASCRSRLLRRHRLRPRRPVDVALYVSLVHGQTASFDNAIEWGPVLQTDVGRVQLNANVFFERTFGARRPVPTQMKYQWQAKVRWLPAWQFGAQGFGELGAWDQWAPQRRQSHRIGPVVFATPELTGREELSIQAAYLGGKTYGTQGHMFSLRVAYSF